MFRSSAEYSTVLKKRSALKSADFMERIRIQNVSKSFHIGSATPKTTLGKLLSVFSGKESDEVLYALRDISFTVEAGEIVGIIGKNGSGKSTLLRILAGIIQKDAGTVQTNGRVVAAIHLDAGVKDRLTMRGNILLLSAFLGFGKKEAEAAFDSIINFSELADFADTKWYQFSDGMKQRAVFAASIHAQPDILLLDEAFAVGDERFKQKGFEKITELAAEGASVVLAGHQLGALERYCERVIWIDRGKIKMEGPSKEGIQGYM